MALMLIVVSLMCLFASSSIYSLLLEQHITHYNLLFKILFGFFGQSFLIYLFNRKLGKFGNYFVFLTTIFFMLSCFCLLLLKFIALFNSDINQGKVCLIICISVIVYMIYGLINSKIIKITRYKIKSDKNINKTIAFVSDIHMGSISMNEKFLNKFIETLNKQENIDYILLGGDIIESPLYAFPNKQYSKIWKKLNRRNGVYGILGNHEYYTGEVYKLVEYLQNNCGIEMLLDDYKIIDHSVVLIGREDLTRNYYGHRKEIKTIVNDIDLSKYFSILLDHNPVKFDDAIANDIDLQLSGHTHNGQFFPFNIVVKFFYEKAYGLLNKQGKNLIVSSGLTPWGIPIKIMSKPEIVLVEIK